MSKDYPSRTNYWTIGHVLKTGLVVPCNPEGIFNFRNHEEYLTFFNNVLVRSSGSIYEKQIAQFYTEYVNSRSDPGIVPLLIPEFRYAGIASRHIYRLDFTLVNPYTQVRYGFELSPWSSHGYIAKTKAMTAAEINEAAQTNFEREMRKHKDFFKRHGIFIRIYTDGDLCDCRRLFDDEIVPLLNVDAPKPPFPFEIARKYGLA